MSALASPQDTPDSGQKRIGFLRRYRWPFQIILVVIAAITVSLFRDWRAERNAIAAGEKYRADFRDTVRFAKDIRNNAFFFIEPDDDRDFTAVLGTATRILAAGLGLDEDGLHEKFAGALRDAVCIDGGLAAYAHLRFAHGNYATVVAQKFPAENESPEAAVEKLLLTGDTEFANESPSTALAAYLEACEKIGDNRSDQWEHAHLRLAIAYDRVKQPEKSAEIWREIVAYRTQQTHSESRGTMTAKRWLATMLWEAGKYEEAEPLMRKPPVFNEHTSLLAQPRSLNDRVLIVSLLEDNGYEDTALSYAEQTLDKFRKYLEDQPVNHSKLLGTMGRINWRQGQRLYAEGYLKNALSTLEKHPPSDTSDLVNAIGSLGGLLADKNKTKEAAALFARARDIHQNAPGGPHPDLAIDLYRLGDVLRAPERQQEAGDLIRQGIEGLNDRKKYDRFYLAEAHWFLARWHQRNGRIAEAKDQALEAIEISTDAEGADHRRTQKYQKYLDGLTGRDVKGGKK